MAATGDIRNVILLGHGGSGKTSLTEAILHTAGAISRLGSVDEKTTVSDYYDEEKEHQHSILASVVHAQYSGKLINLIDAPGSPDFVGPAIAAMPAAETAIIVVNAASGIETNTRKLFALACELGKPRMIVINKIAAENVDMPELIKNIQDTFGSQCRCANLPAADKKSVIDCIENAAGDSPVMSVADAHTQLIESVVEADDALMERYLGGEEIPAAEIATVFVKALRTGKLIPIVFTEARQDVGI
ncbi:MAG: GTP-binding protein [Phycisphaerales bacterium]